MTYSKPELKEVEDWYLNTYKQDPLRWTYDHLEIPDKLWEKQEEIISSVFEHTYTAVRSGHSTGKTFASAVAALAFLYTQIPSKVITTAPTFKQVVEILWRDIRGLHSTARVKLGGILQTARLVNGNNWFALGLHPREYDLNSFQGFHSENILIIFDESPGVSQDLYLAGLSLMASGNAHLLEIGNPVEARGHFYDAFQKESDYHQIHISCLDSPNIKAGKEIRLYLVNQNWIDDQRKIFGESSIEWQSKVLGEFPSSEKTSYVPEEWVRRSFDMEDFDV